MKVDEFEILPEAFHEVVFLGQLLVHERGKDRLWIGQESIVDLSLRYIQDNVDLLVRFVGKIVDVSGCHELLLRTANHDRVEESLNSRRRSVLDLDEATPVNNIIERRTAKEFDAGVQVELFVVNGRSSEDPTICDSFNWSKWNGEKAFLRRSLGEEAYKKLMNKFQTCLKAPKRLSYI